MKRFSIARSVAASEICFQDARMALQAIGFIPLLHLGSAEHWVRGDRRCILYVEGEVSEVVCDQVNLRDAAHVCFQLIDTTLVASV